MLERALLQDFLSPFNFSGTSGTCPAAMSYLSGYTVVMSLMNPSASNADSRDTRAAPEARDPETTGCAMGAFPKAPILSFRKRRISTCSGAIRISGCAFCVPGWVTMATGDPKPIRAVSPGLTPPTPLGQELLKLLIPPAAKVSMTMTKPAPAGLAGSFDGLLMVTKRWAGRSLSMETIYHIV